MFRYVTTRVTCCIGLNFANANVIMKLPSQEARIERYGTYNLAAGSQG
jgi:hypothetical protein